MLERRVEIARTVVSALNTPDPDTYAGYFTADAEIVPIRAALEKTAYRGPDGARQFHADSRESWETVQADILEFREAGDRVFFDARIRSRGRGSGADVETKAFFVVSYDGEKISSLHSYLNRPEALEAAGLSDDSS